jgi:hypothetical protein
MLFAGTLTYLEQKLFLVIMFYNGTFLLQILIVLIMNVCMYIFFLIA